MMPVNNECLLDTKAAYYLRNSETIKEKRRIRYRADVDKANAIQRKSYHKNKEKRRSDRIQWEANNPDLVVKYRRKFHESHPGYRYETFKKSVAKDQGVMIRHKLKCRMIDAMRAKGVKKCTKTMELLGCTIPFFKDYIAKMFVEGMSWDNYGEWHIDHIKPCAKFDLKIIAEQKKCFHYSNLQPLWARDNRIKCAKYAAA